MNDNYYTGSIQPPQYSQEVSVALGPSLWTWVFAAILLFVAIYSAILIYHWVKYAMNKKVITSMVVTHLAIVGVLLFFISGSLVIMLS